ncbi:flagellar assembly protein FliH [Mycoplasmopsis lipofaciens]|uniref:flagellar assembly protein FliH n=1 Tax=Mycoplasmopsis lipofaciens TaxID=114884 RepID=UPI00068D4F56|nr:flagellar assembly protein FliH [Mycoplasmopsis lipofaciens]
MMNKNNEQDSKNNKELIEHYKFILTTVYDRKIEELENLSIEDLKAILEEAQEQRIELEKNPNRFWLVKGMPEPKKVKTKTSAKAGIIVVVAFFTMLALTCLTFLLLAFKPWKK